MFFSLSISCYKISVFDSESAGAGEQHLCACSSVHITGGNLYSFTQRRGRKPLLQSPVKPNKSEGILPSEGPEGSAAPHLSYLKSHGVREADVSIVGTRYYGTATPTSSPRAHSEKAQMCIDRMLQGDANPLVSMRHSGCENCFFLLQHTRTHTHAQAKQHVCQY